MLRDEKYVRFPARDGLEFARIRDAFQKIDADRSGFLDREELSHLLQARRPRATAQDATHARDASKFLQ